MTEVSFEAGFRHRGIEKLAETNTFYQLPFLVSRICSNSSVAHSLASARAIESVSQFNVSSKAQYMRVLFLEIERICGHLEKINQVYKICEYANLCRCIESFLGRLRSQIQKISGNCCHPDLIIPGGVSKIFSLLEYHDLKILIDDIYKTFTDKFSGSLFSDRLKKNLGGLACLDRDLCISLDASGPVARAAGIAADARIADSYYKELSFKPVFGESSDAYGRFKVSFFEIVSSCSIVKSCLERLPDETGDESIPLAGLEKSDGFGSCESVEGKLSHYIRYRGGNVPYSYRISTASEKNMYLYLKALVGIDFSDMNMALATLDICFNCLEK